MSARSDAVTIAREDPRAPELAAMVAALDARMVDLYQAPKCHFAPVDALAEPDVDFVVARENGRALACGALTPAGVGVCQVKRMWTAPDARGRGLGRRVLRALDAHARARGCATLRLEVGTKQPEALALYRSEGFAPCAEPDGDHMFMEKPLGASAPTTDEATET